MDETVKEDILHTRGHKMEGRELNQYSKMITAMTFDLLEV